MSDQFGIPCLSFEQRISLIIAASALRLEPLLDRAFWQVLGALFMCILNIGDTNFVANSPIWAAIRVSYYAAYPFSHAYTADVHHRVSVVWSREQQILREIMAVLRRGASLHLWSEIYRAIRKLIGPETRKDARKIFEIIAQPKLRAEALDKTVSSILWVLIVTTLFRHDSSFALPSTYWLYKIVYPPKRYAWIRLVHAAYIMLSFSQGVAFFQLSVLLQVRRYLRIALFIVTQLCQAILNSFVYVYRVQYERIIWIIAKLGIHLLENAFWDGIFAGVFRLWHGPLDGFTWIGFNTYWGIKLWVLFHEVARRGPFWDNFPGASDLQTHWAMQEQFVYTTLTRDTHIRLLLLHPRMAISDVYCSLLELPIDSLPAYEAISYTWGNSTNTEDIWVNGKRLIVPASAYKILINRSSVLVPKLLWIDAICINQGDTAEKNSQVLLMRDVYRKAFTVSVCLQPPPASQGVLPVQHEISESFLATDMLHEIVFLPFKRHKNDLEIYLEYAQHIRQPRWLAFQSLVRNPWFSRIWVAQEVVLASSTRVFYGGTHIPWRYLVDAMNLCQHHPALGSLLDTTMDPMARLRPSRSHFNLSSMYDFQAKFRNSTVSFSSSLYGFVLFKATDPRDHIFGLFGFYTGPMDHRITPNYNLSLPDVYKNAARYLLDQDQPLHMLSRAGLGYFQDDYSRQHAVGALPSWCPNWSRQPMLRILSIHDPRPADFPYRAGGGMGKQPWCPDSDNFNSLIVRAQILDSIVYLGPPLTGTTDDDPNSGTGLSDIQPLSETIRTFQAAKESWDELEKSNLVQQVYPYTEPPQDLRQAFWRTLIGNKSEAGAPAPSSLSESFEKWMMFGSEIENGSLPVDSGTLLTHETINKYDVQKQFSVLFPACGLGRRLCITKSGYIGMVPPLSVQYNGKVKGDVVCIVQGGQVPLILRPIPMDDLAAPSTSVGAERQRFRLVGEAYIHGIMDGEQARWEGGGNTEDDIILV
jgi:hypothetical protein